ncbi:MAG: DNA-protecting protein DprA [endosymbiont of Galathealinum brachiosum]|uniref:DNA-protecting protein DprA n=1 Tax=endosymbiont of Galathealinum brachiosum TaxID=2200906 RepID=A0A370DD56_9GAMM|nr:MAG: DNA-protecting protein DprA [endosymbiont of Galathealinum brachiosum]
MAALSDNDLHNRLKLVRCNLPFSIIHQLLDQFSSASDIFDASISQLNKVHLTDAQINRIQGIDNKDIERDLAWLDHADHGILFQDDKNFPQQLLEINDPPYALFYIGDIDYLQQPQLAMVGSRTPTAAGKQIAEDFARHLSNAGLTITSGLAHGIDAACHQGALKGIAGTVAVVANGLHTIYPKANTRLAEAISQNGCLITESPVGTDPHKGLFPRRNRIISGLSIGTLVTEAAVNSGSLITTRHAMEQGREVFAIPGSIHNPLAKGCHKLIKSGAKLVETASDILEELLPLVNSIPIRHTSAAETRQSPENNSLDGLDSSYQTLLKHMEFEPVGIDELVERSHLNASDIASMLLILELKDQVVSQNGLYSRA